MFNYRHCLSLAHTGRVGVNEYLTQQAACGMTHALLGGQPLAVLRYGVGGCANAVVTCELAEKDRALLDRSLLDVPLFLVTRPRYAMLQANGPHHSVCADAERLCRRSRHCILPVVCVGKSYCNI